MPEIIGETLFYKASFRGVHAANASLKVLERTTINQDSVYHIQFKAQTRSAFDYIFPINDEIDLWVDTKTFLPIRIHERIQEGKFKRSTKLFFNRNENYAIIDNDTLPIGKYTQSPYSLFYFFRRYNIQDFKDKKLSLIQNKKISQINLKIRKNQIINVPAGDYVCTVASPVRGDNKSFKNKSEMDIMYSNNLEKYPVKIRLKLKYGYLVLELNEIIN